MSDQANSQRTEPFIKAYSLDEVAALFLPPQWTDGARWLARRLNRNELRGTRFGRTWVMDDEDIAYMKERYGNAAKVKGVGQTDALDGSARTRALSFTTTSRRGLRALP
ncbi:DNA-binding protein [Mycobacterium shigaense]|uniref:DNA-binding protein n=1 Tax=Mycobacterium shigaense TaxID=722731 RepID=UPI002ADFC402|nr:DNA-binding protein [Mycobacterium shigaense]MEA1123901.1 DNA-binding protein [Mycobacterium shigaense]